MVVAPCEYTLTEASQKIFHGELSSVELVESCLERISNIDDRIQAWVYLNREGAIAAAKDADRELHERRYRGPLHGIPVGVKDIFYTAGMPTEAGSRTWAGFIPKYDAAAVAKLKEAGAFVLGKTFTTEFATFDPAPTRNPWDTEHTPGGSSSGSGAAVAARMCPVALGSQTSGSVLRPASYNGVVGFKPQHGRISAYGVVPVSWTLDHVGVLTRCVSDAALMLQALGGQDARDPYSLDVSPIDPIDEIDKWDRPPRLGFATSSILNYADAEMKGHTEAVIKRLEQAGAIVEEVSLPSSFLSIAETHRIIMYTECAAFHQEMFAEKKDLYGPKARMIIEEGLGVGAVQYALALQERIRHQDEVRLALRNVDALITYGAPGVAPKGLSSTGDPVMQRPWSHIGIPSLSLPTGLNESGLPLGIQLVGQFFGESELLAIGSWCERVFDFSDYPNFSH